MNPTFLCDAGNIMIKKCFSFHNKSLYSCNKNTISYLYISLWIKTCNTVMHKLLITFLSISQIVKAGKLQQKARHEGQYRLEICELNGLWRQELNPCGYTVWQGNTAWSMAQIHLRAKCLRFGIKIVVNLDVEELWQWLLLCTPMIKLGVLLPNQL